MDLHSESYTILEAAASYDKMVVRNFGSTWIIKINPVNSPQSSKIATSYIDSIIGITRCRWSTIVFINASKIIGA